MMNRTRYRGSRVVPQSRKGTPTHPQTALCAAQATPEAAAALRGFVRHMGRRWGLEEDVEQALALITSELVTNVVLHSGSPDLILTLRAGVSTVTVQVRDRGAWKPQSEPQEDACCGRGLLLVHACAEQFTLRLTPSGTVAGAELPLTAPATRMTHRNGCAAPADPKEGSAAAWGLNRVFPQAG